MYVYAVTKLYHNYLPNERSIHLTDGREIWLIQVMCLVVACLTGRTLTCQNKSRVHNLLYYIFVSFTSSKFEFNNLILYFSILLHIFNYNC
jgi:hypothetical protein